MFPSVTVLTKIAKIFLYRETLWKMFLYGLTNAENTTIWTNSVSNVPV